MDEGGVSAGLDHHVLEHLQALHGLVLLVTFGMSLIPHNGGPRVLALRCEACVDHGPDDQAVGAFGVDQKDLASRTIEKIEDALVRVAWDPPLLLRW